MELDYNKTENAVSVTTITLVGYSADKYPIDGGNCFSVLTDEDKEYRIVNFGHENWEEMINRGVDYPIKIIPISERQAIVHDSRIPHSWYSDRFCEVCTPLHLRPITQRLRTQRDIECGAEVHSEHCIRFDRNKRPDLRTEEEIKEAEERRKNMFKGWNISYGEPIIAVAGVEIEDEIEKELGENDD